MMIKYDYKLERHSGGQIEIFSAVKGLQNLPTAAYVKGPNSLGKSTLLNIIALCFYGHQMADHEIARQLKERLSNLLDIDHQQLTFTAEINNEITGDVLFCEKKNPSTKEIILYRILNGVKKPLSPDAFNREFRLLYDIPIDPLERLPNLLFEVRNSQFNIGNKISDFRLYLRELIKKIQDSKNPEQINNIRNQIEKIRQEIGELTNNKTTAVGENKKITLYYLSRSYIHLHELLQQEQAELDSINVEIKKLGKETKQVAKDHTKKTIELRSKIEQAKTIKNDLKKILPSMIQKEMYKVRYSLWNDGDIEEEIYHPGLKNNLREESAFFKEYLLHAYEKKKVDSKEVLDKVELYGVLLQALESFQFKDTPVPGINQPVKAFINLIRLESQKFYDEMQSLKNYEKCIDDLDRFSFLISNSIEIAKVVKDAQQDVRSGFYSSSELVNNRDNLENSLSTHRTELAEIEKELKGLKLDDIKTILQQLTESPELQIYINYSDTQLLEKIKALKKNISDDSDKLIDKERILKNSEVELVRLQDKETHPWFEYLPILEDKLQHTLQLEKKIKVNYEQYIRKATEPNRTIDKTNSEEVNYYEKLGYFLGKKIRIIRHIHDQYEVRYIDVFKKVILTPDREIRFSDLGTGQGQAAYLVGLLSSQGNKKIIALFDEVAMMDETSLGLVKQKLRELYSEGKLLASIIVQKDEIESVESII